MKKSIQSVSIVSLVLSGALLLSACSEQQQDEAKFLIEQAKEKTKEKGDGGD